MFNVGGGEILVILLVALLVLGPGKLPEAARQVGNVLTQIRKVSTGFQNELKSALEEPAKPKTPATPVDGTVSGPAAVAASATADPEPDTDTGDTDTDEPASTNGDADPVDASPTSVDHDAEPESSDETVSADSGDAADD